MHTTANLARLASVILAEITACFSFTTPTIAVSASQGGGKARPDFALTSNGLGVELRTHEGGGPSLILTFKVDANFRSVRGAAYALLMDPTFTDIVETFGRDCDLRSSGGAK